MATAKILDLKPTPKENGYQPTYRDLMDIWNSIVYQVMPIKGLAYLERGRIRDFQNTHGQRIASTNQKLVEIEKKYFKYDEAGKIIMTEGERPEPILLEGMIREDFQVEVDKILSQPCLL